MECLPNELLLKLMKCMEPREACRLSATCTRFRAIGKEPAIFKCVSFKNCRWITKEGLSSFLCQYGAFIISLSLRQCYHLRGNCLSEHKPTLRNLRDLDIIGCSFTMTEIIKSVAGLESLINLKMEDFHSVSSLSNVSLLLRQRFISTIAQLHSLVLYYIDNKATSLVLRGIEMSQLASYTVVSNLEVSAEFLSKLKHVTSLEVFIFSSYYFTHVTSYPLTECLPNCHRVNRFGWSMLQTPCTLLPKFSLGKTLKSLRIPRSGLNDSICSVIAASELELEELDLSWSFVTGDGLVEMSRGKIDGLKKLWLRNTELFYMYSGNGDRYVSVDGITCVLEKATHLVTLDIASEIPSNVPVESFHHLLTSLTDMKELSLPAGLTAVSETSTFCQVSTSLSAVTSFSIIGHSKKGAKNVPLLLNNSLLADLSKWKHLESLKLSCIQNMRSTVGLVTIAQRCYCLRQLCISDIGLHGHSSTLASLPRVLKHCNQLEVFRYNHLLFVKSLEQRLFSFSPHFGDGLSTCSNLKFCRLCFIDGRVDSESVMGVLEKCSCLMGFSLFAAMKKAHCRRLEERARSMCGGTVILVFGKEPNVYGATIAPSVQCFLETGSWLDQLGTLY